MALNGGNKQGMKTRKKRTTMRHIMDYSFCLIYAASSLILLFIALQIFFISSFKIPSDSMYPALEAGDNIWICKPVIGPRIFNIFASLQNKQTTIYRLPGLKQIQRDRKSTRLNSSHNRESRMPSSA